MIQRLQTLWLLGATAAAIFSFMFPFATGTELVENSNMEKTTEIIAGNNLFTLLLTVVLIGISGITIFLFKNRKQQLWLCLLGVLVSTGLIVLYISQMTKLIKPVPALSSILPALVIVSFIMAFRGIRKDDKLVKSLDKLR